MRTKGIQAVFLETHNWGRAAKFFQALGYELEFETDHNSGELRNGDSPYIFIAEVPEDQPPQVRLVLQLPDADEVRPDPALEVVSPFRTPTTGRGRWSSAMATDDFGACRPKPTTAPDQEAS